MALLAYNKTTAPLALAAGNPIRTLPAAPALGSRADGFDVTSEERNLSQADYALLQAQVDAELVEFEWSEQVEYGTYPLQVNIPGIPQEIFTIHVSPASASPPGDDANDGSIGAPVLTYLRATELVPIGWKSRFARILVHGAVDFVSNNDLSNLNFGHQSGTGTPLVVEMDVASQVVGTAAAGTTASNLISSTPLVTRSGSDITVSAGPSGGTLPAGLMRLSGASLSVFTAADAGLTSILVRRAANQGNNGSCFSVFSVGAGGPNTIDIINPQGSAIDAGNGAIYWQESFLGRTVRIDTTAIVGFTGAEKQIRDHGLAGSGLLTLLPKASIADNWRFTVADTLGQTKGFEFQVTGGFVPTPGFITINISSVTIVTAADVAGVTLAVTLPAMDNLWNVKTSRATSTQIRFRQLIEGSAGNVTPVQAGGAAFTFPAFTGGVGALLTTVIMNTPLTNDVGASTAPAVGNTFSIMQNTGYVQYGYDAQSGPQVMEAFVSLVGFKNALFVNRGDKALIFRTTLCTAEGFLVRANGRAFNVNNNSDITAGTNAAQSIWNNAGVNNPFTLFLRLGKGLVVYDAPTILFAAFARMTGHVMLYGSVVTHQALSLTNFATIWNERTTWNNSNGPFQVAGPSRMRGQRVVNAVIGILNVSSTGNLAAAANLEISDSGGHGLQISGKSSGNILTTVSGDGNANNGINATQDSGAVATGATITGNLGDMKVGNKASRFWGDFNATAPIGIEQDTTGDGSIIRTTTSTAFGLTQLVSGGAVPTVAAGPGAGAAPTSLTVVGDNVSGTVTLVTNVADTPAANDDIFTLTFSAPGFLGGVTPRVMWEAANDPAANLAFGVVRGRQADTTNLLAKLRSGAVPLPALTADTYIWNYHIIAK